MKILPNDYLIELLEGLSIKQTISSLVKTLIMINLSTNPQYTQLNIYGCWHLAYYLPANRAEGTLAHKIIEFKNGSQAAIKRWSKWAAVELEKLDIHFDYIVRALSSQETVPLKGKPCSKLGRYLAEVLNAEYAAMALSKSRKTRPLHSLSNRAERIDELRGVYQAHPDKYNFNDKNILIIDDVTTANITITEIVRAMQEVWPTANLYFFCLGKTEYDNSLNDNITKEYFNDPV